jgi:hypothetical protein
MNISIQQQVCVLVCQVWLEMIMVIVCEHVVNYKYGMVSIVSANRVVPGMVFVDNVQMVPIPTFKVMAVSAVHLPKFFF